MKKQRKQYAPEEKVAILRRHLLEKEPISSCAMKWDSSRRSSTAGRRNSSRTGLLPSSRNGQPTIPLTRSGLHTRQKIQTKDEVLAELMAEHVALKNDIGEL
jgi:transposase